MAFAVPLPVLKATSKREYSLSLRCNVITAQSPVANGQKSRLRRLCDAIVTLERLTRPGQRALPSRYEKLPDHVKTESQMLGRMSPGCEGTTGVFPRCNFSCHPCYHSADANKVRIDGLHTVTEVARQMDTLRKQRGPIGHCQLIGGEVSLLPPEDHVLALETMRYFGRIPMSFTHGDFDYEYLYRLAVLPSGRPRFSRIDFAVHFDIGMRGRKGVSRLHSESQLTPHRRRFVAMFQRLRRENGVRFYLAHNMTVQPDNLPTIADAVKDLIGMGFRLISFQPAALQGARQVDTLRNSVVDDEGASVWHEIERGAGIRLSYSLFQMGDVRCNRMAVCGVVGAGQEGLQSVHIFLLFDDTCSADVHSRDLIMRHLGNIVLPPRLLALKIFRAILIKPWLLIPALSWCFRVMRRAGGLWAIIRHGIQPLTIVLHRFMDAEDVAKAWQLMEHDIPSHDARVDAAGPRIRETMERLAACSYSMAHPDDGRVVPACVQHSVYDGPLNKQLTEQLPLSETAQPASAANLDFF